MSNYYTTDQIKQFPKHNPEATLIPFDPGAETGDNCPCSYCGFAIYGTPIRLPIMLETEDGEDVEKEFRLHIDCGKEALQRGLAAIL